MPENLKIENQNNVQHKAVKFTKVVLWIGGICYMAVLLRIIMFKYGLTSEFREISLIPFQFINDIFHHTTSMIVVLKNILGNIAIFIPFGLLLSLTFSKLSYTKVILLSAAFSFLLELTQYITGLGLSDIDDIILNTLGGAVGGAITLLFRRLSKKILVQNISAILFLGVFGICGLIAVMQLDPRLMPKQTMEVVNEEVLEGFAHEKEDAWNKIEKIEGEQVITSDGTYALSEQTRYFMEEREYTYTVSGNISKIKRTYSKISKEDVKDLLASEKQTWNSLWLDEAGNCSVIIITVFDN